MKANLIHYFNEFSNELINDYFEEIRNHDQCSFIRHRKITIPHLFLQMFSNQGLSRKNELINFYQNIDMNLDVSQVAFYKARMKINPEAINMLANDFIANIYDKEDESMVKLNGYYVFAVDGSDIVIPRTSENIIAFGQTVGLSDQQPCMGKVSIIYDCINKCIFDTQIGSYKYPEIDLAEKHIDILNDSLRKNGTPIVIFDRGYYSHKLMLKIIENQQKFLFRLSSNQLKRFQTQVADGEDKEIDITFDRIYTNEYRHNPKLRIKLMNSIINVRIAKIPIVTANGEVYYETLLTNLNKEEFNADALKELYHLRWDIETCYNEIKNRLKLEEFSGYKETIIKQDIYITSFLYNMISVAIIEANQERENVDNRYKYQMKANKNHAISIFKSMFIRVFVKNVGDEIMHQKLLELINKELVPIRPNRTYLRKTAVEKSRRSYKYSY